MKNRSAFEEARRFLPGGVNSPVRAFKGVGGTPVTMARGKGAVITDIEGRNYVDYVGSWGPLIVGHASPKVLQAISAAARKGTTFGAPTLGETELAKTLCRAAGLDRVRLVSSGTEACMSALRLARAFSKREGLIKFEGCYHGHSDPFLIKAGSGLATFGISSSAGVPPAKTFVLPYNDAEALEQVIRKQWRQIGAVIVEPIAGNMGVVLPKPDFIRALRRLTAAYGIILIFDEVITGFRLRFGTVQPELKTAADLTTLGKIVGGGMPLAAFGGKAAVMRLLAPEGPVYQAGTLSGNPVAVAAGLATLRAITANIYVKLDALAQRLSRGIAEAARRRGIPVTINRAGSMLTVFFTDLPVTDWTSAAASDTERYAKFFHGMLERGIYLPPSQFEAWFVSAAHTEKQIDATIRAADETFANL